MEKSRFSDRFLYPTDRPPFNTLRSVGYLSKETKLTRVSGGSVRQIDIDVSLCLVSNPCMHLKTYLIVKHDGKLSYVAAPFTSGDKIQALYMLLGEPGWIGQPQAEHHFSKYRQRVIDNGLCEIVKYEVETAVEQWKHKQQREKSKQTNHSASHTSSKPRISIAKSNSFHFQVKHRPKK